MAMSKEQRRQVKMLAHGFAARKYQHDHPEAKKETTARPVSRGLRWQPRSQTIEMVGGDVQEDRSSPCREKSYPFHYPFQADKGPFWAIVSTASLSVLFSASAVAVILCDAMQERCSGIPECFEDQGPHQRCKHSQGQR
jgi:hypothetical protein